MRALNTVLWIAGLACVLSVVGLLLPMSGLEAMAGWFGDQPLSSRPVFEYGLRVMCATYVVIGVFLIILARDPQRYGPMVPFTGIAALALGVCCGVTGLLVGLPLAWFAGDALACILVGILVLAFWRRAAKPAEEASREQRHGQ